MTVTLITGTSKGIGLTMAVELAKAGHDVYASMRDPARADALLGAAKGAGVAVRVVQLDVLDDDSVTTAVNAVTDDAGQIDVLINNAGVAGQGGPVEFLPLDAFREVMETNFYGPIRCMQAVLQSMRERDRGAIINISSVAGVFAGPMASAYSSSKFALEAVTETLAAQLADTNVRVALVEPGFIYTAILDDLPRPPPPEPGTPYENVIRRGGATFRSSAAIAAPPERVAEVVLDIVSGETWQLRNPVGPIAVRMFERLGVQQRELPLSIFRSPDDEWEKRWSDFYGCEIRL